ncbi:MAG: nitrogenase component 1 [Methylocella sp.]
MARNPFLPRRPIRWQGGPSKGLLGIPALSVDVLACPQPGSTQDAYRKDPRGRKPKDPNATPRQTKLISADLHEAPIARAHPDAGKFTSCTGPFFLESNSGWGSNLDMMALAHGPVGCGVFTQASRLNLPGFEQGIESFTALHACTDLTTADLEDGGDAKLARALDELQTLFPLSRGVTIMSEDPIALLDSNVKGIAKAKAKESGRLIVPRSCEFFRVTSPWVVETAAALKAAASSQNQPRSTPYDVALPFCREAVGLVWILDKLLRDIGLNPIHEVTGSSASDMARISQCRLVIGFAEKLDVPIDYFPGGYARLLQQWYNMPLVWACFAGPSATDASLRAIASRFDSKIRVRAERTIAANRKKIDAIAAPYRPRLEGKLVVHFYPMTDEQLEPYRLLGLRIGNATGWPGKTTKWRTPRLVCDPESPSEKAIDSYIAEAKPDLVLCYGRNEYDWHKRGRNALPFTPLFDRRGNAFWGYDGFACFAATLDRTLNAPWTKLLKPPWRRTVT